MRGVTRAWAGVIRKTMPAVERQRTKQRTKKTSMSLSFSSRMAVGELFIFHLGDGEVFDSRQRNRVDVVGHVSTTRGGTIVFT